ncbi:PP2C family protein-serine/threonine phosphatase [Leptolyngbya sp. NIES-2104]|uniref:PP2C family protein-serine/threonine phosphatase n=1 Tax=Leptolyngbya sp. NIES-2104 TaxID=1552121 RepID=UPI0006ECCB3A|nr:protein phosphatase 2C domain-containing protein [Leptolyngbya sp. NIES-2104]GAP94029.1 serine/threonine phosphatase [Leptolyngbya sp. NIES-2104]
MKSLNYFARSETNQRENNEDCHNSFLLEDQGVQIPVFVIADGMGGHEHGEDVSRQAVLKVEDFLKKTVDQVAAQADSIDYLKQVLLDAIESANELVQRMVSVNGWDRAGSTIVIALIWNNKAIAANLGDSPLFHWSQKTGELVRVTQDHSVPGILAQANLISEEMARYHERRGQLEFFLGCKTLPQPDPVYERTLEPGDLLLLCSDGISGSLSREQLKTILSKPIDLPEQAEQLIQAARNEGETDNQTVILWRYKVPSQATSIRKLPAATSVRSQPTLIQSSLTTQVQSPPRNRRKRTLSRRGLFLITAVCLAGAIAAIFIGFQLLTWIQAQSDPLLTQPTVKQVTPQQPAQTPIPRSPFHEFESLSADGSTLTTKDPDTQQFVQWHAPKLKAFDKNCRSNTPEPDDPQAILQQSPEQIITKSKTLGCIRLWKLKSPQGNSPLRQVEKPAIDVIVSIQGEHS